MILYLLLGRCERIDYNCAGTRLVQNGENTYNWKDCGRRCLFNANCKKWHWFGKKNKCFMYSECEMKKAKDKGSRDVAGTKECPGSEG